MIVRIALHKDYLAAGGSAAINSDTVNPVRLAVCTCLLLFRYFYPMWCGLFVTIDTPFRICSLSGVENKYYGRMDTHNVSK